MEYKMTAASAARWALSKIGCTYSQAKRTKEQIFDCSSLVARAYSAQGKRWKHGGEIPISMHEVYDDDFELLWPATYAEIGEHFGGSSAIKLARQAGDLQFICTDSSTSRSNKITHVAMVSDKSTIVHARSSKHGVCSNSILLYSGKICAVVRYNPSCDLRIGMCGWRTLSLQKMLNTAGFTLSEDGEFGNNTRSAVQQYQLTHGLEATGEVDSNLMKMLRNTHSEAAVPVESCIFVSGNQVNVRKGPGTQFASILQVSKGQKLEEIDCSGWIPIEIDNEIYWISEKYICRQSKAGENDT